MSITAGPEGVLTVVVTDTANPTYAFPTHSASGSVVIAATDTDVPTITMSHEDYKHLNFTDMRADHWSHHAGYDCSSLIIIRGHASKADDHLATTPRNMMIGFAALLLLCMLVQHTRFLARLFASLPELKTGRKRSARDDMPPVSAMPNSATFLAADRSQYRKVGGGGLFSGWILRKGQQPTGLTSPELASKEGFQSPIDVGGGPLTATSATSSSFPPASAHAPARMLPPPHVKPALNHLPFARWLHVSPFSRLPSPFGSILKVPQLYIIGAYISICAVALFWKSNPLPPTPERPHGNDFQRSGLIGMVQIPLVIALGVRGNIIGLCVGKGYERLKAFHKIVGRVCFIASTIHTAFWSEHLSSVLFLFREASG